MINPKVSIVIVNWNGLEDTLICLDSVRKLKYPHFEIIVVDNGSKHDVEKLEKINDIKLVKLAENTGFTGGHIAGYKAADGDYIAIINNDLVLDKNWLGAVIESMHRHKNAAVVGGRNYHWDDNNPVLNEENSFFTYQELTPGNAQTRTLLTGEEECIVDSISGAALLIKRKAVDEVGYFDDIFFAYYEETDLIARLKRAGYEAYYNPEAKVWHKVAASSEGGDSGKFYLYQMHRNRYIFAFKNLDEPIAGQFISNYRAEVLKARARWLRFRDLESGCRVNASKWINKNKKILRLRRAEVQKMGGSYISHLGTYKPLDVTVIIPCFNYGNYVSEAVDSVLNQTLKPSKIIIINDGSTDNSKQVIDKYKNKPSVEIIHKQNGGVVETKNLGLKLSKTYWTVFLDADDYIEKDYLQKLVYLGNKERSDVIYTDMRYFGAVEDVFKSRPFNLFDMLQRNYIHNSALIKTSLLKQVGGYKEVMKDGLEDWELYLSLVEIGARFSHLPESSFYYRQHEGALSQSRNQSVLAKERQLYEQLISLHPGLFKVMGPRRRKALRGLRFGYKLIRHPGVWPVIVVAIPTALVSGIRTELHEIRRYLAEKEKRS